MNDLYLCNGLNGSCRPWACYKNNGDCHYTTDIKYAIKDINDNPTKVNNIRRSSINDERK